MVFGVPGLAAVVAGVLVGRFLGRFGYRKVLAAGLFVQGLTILPLVFLGADQTGLALAVVISSLFVGFFAHVICIVAYTVTGTTGLPNEEQGVAAGLTSLTQQVALTVGIPFLGAIAATQSVWLAGFHLALTVGVIVTFVSVALIWFGLRPRDEQSSAVSGVPVSKLSDAAMTPD